MAIVAHVVEKTVHPGDSLVNGIVGLVLAIDNAVDNTDTKVKARAVTVLVAAGHKVPDGYFDTNRLCSTYDAAGDITVFAGPIVHHAIA